MNKVRELRKTSDIVKQILKEDEYARNDDNYLYAKVLETLAPNMLKKPFWVVLNSIACNDLPQFETVRRTRQKVQELNADLKPCERIRSGRAENEAEYRFWVTEE